MRKIICILSFLLATNTSVFASKSTLNKINTATASSWNYVSVQEQFKYTTLDTSKGHNGIESFPTGGGNGYVTIYFPNNVSKRIYCEFMVNKIGYIPSTFSFSPKSAFMTVQDKYRYSPINKSKANNGFEYHMNSSGTGYVIAHFIDGGNHRIQCEFCVNGVYYVKE